MFFEMVFFGFYYFFYLVVLFVLGHWSLSLAGGTQRCPFPAPLPLVPGQAGEEEEEGSFCFPKNPSCGVSSHP